MDLRIVNICNNNCLYCLEQSLRKKEKYLNKNTIFNLLRENKKRDNLNFYGGNSLLHPDLLKIIKFSKSIGFKNIGILTNSFGIERKFLLDLKQNGLNSFGVYFNSFSKDNHNLIVGENGIKLKDLLGNIVLLKSLGFFIKIIIHINNKNIDTIYKDIFLLKQRYLIENFEFINYFPFDRPYENKNTLEYSILDKIEEIKKLFNIIKKLNLKVNFVKFNKIFFGDYIEFYNYRKGILEQIGEEDIDIFKGEERPFCLIEKRCKYCFLKNNCRWYGK